MLHTINDSFIDLERQKIVMRNCLNEMGAPGAVRLITNNMSQELFDAMVMIIAQMAKKYGYQYILQQLEFVGLIYGA